MKKKKRILPSIKAMMRMMTDKNTFVLTDDDRRFKKTARKILANEKVQQMKQYVQHGDVPHMSIALWCACMLICMQRGLS